MVKIWARIIKNEKTVKQLTMFDRVEKMDYSKFFDYVSQLCQNLDIPTPVILKTHIFNYAKFNFVRFKPDDFVEKVNFDALYIENAAR